MFFQLKHVFHMLESLGSARIEGNHTTLADYVESKLEGSRKLPPDQLREMGNIEAAMAYIEESVQHGHLLTEHFVRELHAITVGSLEREGDATPGAYRRQQVRIARSEHLPPEWGCKIFCVNGQLSIIDLDMTARKKTHLSTHLS